MFKSVHARTHARTPAWLVYYKLTLSLRLRWAKNLERIPAVSVRQEYRYDPKFSDRYVWANSADPDQIAPRGAVWSGSSLFAFPFASFWWNKLRFGLFVWILGRLQQSFLASENLGTVVAAWAEYTRNAVGTRCLGTAQSIVARMMMKSLRFSQSSDIEWTCTLLEAVVSWLQSHAANMLGASG